MVLTKRKTVQFLPRPDIQDDATECWIIPETSEVFLSYESYLQRMDWLKSKRFTCEISGHSGLSFFDALKSEAQGAKEVDSSFPEALKEPVLRKVQFSTISRIDNLVDKVFDDFKHDFYPGEQVTVQVEAGDRENGLVRDKAVFPEIRDKQGDISREAFSRYFVKLVDHDDLEILVDDLKVARDRKVFTKQMLRQFLKNTVSREAWNGAPWLVKPQYAEFYRIDTNIPPHLLYNNRQAEKKEKKKNEQDNLFGVWASNKLPELKPAPKHRKNQGSADHALQQAQYAEYQRALQADPTFAATHGWAHLPLLRDTAVHTNGHANPPSMNGRLPSSVVSGVQIPPRPASPPPIKYPIEDMELKPAEDGSHRPELKFVTESQVQEDGIDSHVVAGLQERTVGLLLEIWNTVSVYCQVLSVDSFTFDDFVDAMQFSSSDIECELFAEVHCAILKKLVNAEGDHNGAIQISLPDLPETEETEEEEEEESRLPSPTPEPDVPARRTRSSLNKMQLAEEQKEETPEPDVVITHRAAEMFSEEYGWIDRLRQRDFRHGGWQLVMVGLLHQLAGRPRLHDICESILIHLAPLSAEPTIRTVETQYTTMDINLRAQALQLLCQLFMETKTVKNFLEEMSNTMTQYRKVKIEHQRARKEAVARLKPLLEERRTLAPQERSPTPPPELEDAMDIDKVDDLEITIADSDEEPVMSRSLRRGQDRAAERKRKREQEQERKDKAAAEKQNKGSKEYQKVLKAIEKERELIDEHEEAIEIVDNDLREADCPRTRVLGKDRFCNRYWWFERNAMPYAGLPDSSTADANYANGRLWVQGPDDMERLGFIDVEDRPKQNYFRNFGVTPAERKTMEEGPTHLVNAHQWGFYDTRADLDALIAWLDSRGSRELKLKKELSLQKEIIAKYMENRLAYITIREPSEEPTTRMSTRTKTYIGENVPRCLKWRNTSALEEFGHRHIDPPPKPRGRGKKGEATLKSKEAAMQASALNKQGKPVTRQGTRYNF